MTGRLSKELGVSLHLYESHFIFIHLSNMDEVCFWGTFALGHFKKKKHFKPGVKVALTLIALL